jgi:hypothetical protein
MKLPVKTMIIHWTIAIGCGNLRISKIAVAVSIAAASSIPS